MLHRAALAFAVLLAALPVAATTTYVPPEVQARQARELTSQAIAYEHGEGVDKDPLKAVALYCEAAKLGDADAQHNLGWMYANGRGVPRDNRLAALFFGMAAYQGHLHAERMLRFVGYPPSELPDCLKIEVVVVKPEPPKQEEDSWETLFGALSPERQRIVELVKDLAPRYSVDPKLALAVITAESNFEPKARSSKNAQGLMQLIPETAERFNVRNAFDPVQNLKGGLAYLRWLLAYFKGNVMLVAAGYNAGERAVDRYRGVPPYQETQSYVRKILALFKKETHPYDSEVTEPSPVLDRLRPVRR